MCDQEDAHKDRALLAQFHDTVSDQLNSRLTESPKFFGLLVVISTGYAYVISGHVNNPDSKIVNGPDIRLLIVATLLTYSAGVWAAWYLAALGYSFRFLQHTQHSIECELGWDKFTLRSANTGKENVNKLLTSKSVWARYFWLLPSIYHAHIAGMIGFFAIICFSFGCCAWPLLKCHLILSSGSVAAFIAGTFWVFKCNRIYMKKYCNKLAKSSPGWSAGSVIPTAGD